MSAGPIPVCMYILTFLTNDLSFCYAGLWDMVLFCSVLAWPGLAWRAVAVPVAVAIAIAYTESTVYLSSSLYAPSILPRADEFCEEEKDRKTVSHASPLACLGKVRFFSL